MSDSQSWMVCSACRKGIGFSQKHWVCSVSTCNRQRTRLVFCSVGCWDSHLSVLRHRDAWAVEAHAPSRADWEVQRLNEEREALPSATPIASPVRGTPPPQRRVVESAPMTVRSPAPSSGMVASSGTGASAAASAAASEDDMLIVMSKMKKYIRDKSGMNTSDAVGAVLSDHVRAICDEAIRIAGADGRKTVLDRDVPKPRR